MDSFENVILDETQELKEGTTTKNLERALFRGNRIILLSLLMP
ncbi:MAG: LSM domain-containing protein [Candidatus Hodarchaeota archaeon]